MAEPMLLTHDYLQFRIACAINAGWPKAKWMEFCEAMLALGFELTLYEAKSTVSKYITVWDRTRSFKVRYSNHKPAWHREREMDCDFFVGKCNFGTWNTAQAIAAAKEHFGVT
jgi:hypothetical protein